MFPPRKGNFQMIPPILQEAREMALNLIRQRYPRNFVFLAKSWFLLRRPTKGRSPIFRTQITQKLVKLSILQYLLKPLVLIRRTSKYLKTTLTTSTSWILSKSGLEPAKKWPALAMAAACTTTNSTLAKTKPYKQR